MTEVKKVPKKRGRKPKKKNLNEPKPPPKKRGRKPKGGKIIKKNQKIQKNEIISKPNIILHLKCNSKDLNNLHDFNTSYNPCVSNPESYNIHQNNKLGELQYEEIKENTQQLDNIIENNKKFNKSSNINIDNNTNNTNNTNKKHVKIRELWAKLDILKRNLRTNNVSDKRSACFWCTYEFDNPAVHIPKQYNGDVLEVYGCFCSPECACSYLKNEQLDDSTKWERYSLLNNVYGKIYEYSKNVKPAPDPHYTLDKYYGNLTIQEYRKLLRKERIFMVVNKPMTKILPELYEENNEIPNVYNNILDTKQSNNTKFRLKRNQNKQTKANALTNTFNL
tara:strand:- start:951 stop:1955 length:1005 start_codon:yes stop_codon:yes gene_type:complete